MNQRQLALILERQRLLIRSGELRDQIVQQSASILMPTLSVLDRGRIGIWWLRMHPALVSAVGAVVVVGRPRLVFRWGLRAWSAWRTLRRWQRYLTDLAQL